jgi:hypothetical protein
LRRLYIDSNYKKRVASVRSEYLYDGIVLAICHGLPADCRKLWLYIAAALAWWRTLSSLPLSLYLLLLIIIIILSINRSYVIPLCVTNTLKWNILSFNCLKDSDIFNFVYLLRLKVLYLVDRVSVKTNKSILFGS